MNNSLQGRDTFPWESSQSNSYPSLQQKKQISQQNPAKDDCLQFAYSSQQTVPSVGVLTSQPNPPKIDDLARSSLASDPRKQPQAFSGVVSNHQSSNQPQPQQELPSGRAPPLSQNHPKTNHPQPPKTSDKSQKEEPHHHHPPSFQTSDKYQKQEQPTKDNHHLFSDQSSNQLQHEKQLSSAQVPPLKQNPGKNDNPPPKNQTAHLLDRKQPQSGFLLETHPSIDQLETNQQQPPSGKTGSNQSQLQLPPVLRPPSNDNPSSTVFAVSSTTTQGNPPKPTPTTVRTDPPSQPRNDEHPTNNYAEVHDEPVIAYPDPTYYLPPPKPAPPPPPPRSCCCSIL